MPSGSSIVAIAPGRPAAEAGRPTLSEPRSRVSASWARSSPAGTRLPVSVIAHAGIEDAVEDVRDEVEDDDRRRRDHQPGHHRVGIVRAEGIDEVEAHPVEREHGLRDDRAPEQAAEVERHDRHDRDQRVAEGVLHRHAPLVQPLRPRGAHVVGIDDLEHGRPQEARVGGDAGHHQHHHRHDEMVRPVDPEAEAGAGVDRAEVRDREDEVAGRLEDLDDGDLGHQGEPEQRRGEAEEAEGGRRVVEHRVLPQGGKHSDPDCEQDRDQLRGDDELQRVLHHAHEVGEDLLVREERRAELVRRRVLHPEPVLLHDRIVEVLALPDVLNRLARDVRRRVQPGQGVAGDRDERERQEARRHEHDDAVEEASGDVGQHRTRAGMLRPKSCRGARSRPRARRGRDVGATWGSGYLMLHTLAFHGLPSVVGLTTGPLTFAERMTKTGRAYTGIDGTSGTMYLFSASFSIVARCDAESVVETLLRMREKALLQYCMSFWSPPHAYRSLIVIGVAGEPTHVNMIRSQSREGSVVPNSVPATWNLAFSWMPTDFSCRWMISNVNARSWLPVVVPKRNSSLPTFGHVQILSLFAAGRSGPPVQPRAFSMLMTLP